MEPLVMGRTLIRWAIALACLCAIAFLVMLATVRPDHAVRHVRRGNEWHDAPVKRYVPPTAEEMRNYLQIVGDIVAAYSNGQEKAMYEGVARFPKAVYGLRGNDHHKVELPLARIWCNERVRLREDGLKEFALAEDFERAMHMSMSLARIYGRFEVDSELEDYTIVSIEWEMLGLLQKYKDKFTREGKSDCLRVTERFLAEWIAQIESEQGFTRAYVRRQDQGLRRRRLVERGETTAEELRRCVRGGAYPLQKFCGYTPKWLDEEFPLLPEEKESKGADASTNAGR